jgi:ABC-type amino acid transport substrate-binding protein
MGLNLRRFLFSGSALLIVMTLFAAQSVEAQALDGTLKRIKASGTINLGYMQFAPPFSLLGADKMPAGYSVDLCKHVASVIQKQLNVTLKLNWVEVTTENRINMVDQGKVDLECTTSTVTLSRQDKVDFSLMTYVDGGTFLTLATSPIRSLSDLSGKRIAVIPGTTTEKALAKFLKDEFITAVTVPVKDHTEGRTALENGSVAALASDQGILIGLALTTSDPKRFSLSDRMISYEPYAFMLHRNDAAFRTAVNRALAGLYRSGEVMAIYDRWFGVLGKPGDAIKAMYMLNGLPE